MSDSTSETDEEPERSIEFNRARTNIFGNIYALQLHTGVGNNNADASNI